jgi:hypothetical protein
MDKIPEDMRAFIDLRIREGFDSVHEIIKSASHYALETLERSNLRTEINSVVADSLVKYRAEQGTWGSLTDCDRLDKAFASLNCQGIVARQNFSCCNNCGFTEIWDEVEQEEKHQSIEGYVFYHLQFTELAIKTGQLLLAYGCIEEEEADLTRVANRIVVELRRFGLDAKWQGSADYPIIVENIMWQKRR